MVILPGNYGGFHQELPGDSPWNVIKHGDLSINKRGFNQENWGMNHNGGARYYHGEMDNNRDFSNNWGCMGWFPLLASFSYNLWPSRWGKAIHIINNPDRENHGSCWDGPASNFKTQVTAVFSGWFLAWSHSFSLGLWRIDKPFWLFRIPPGEEKVGPSRLKPYHFRNSIQTGLEKYMICFPNIIQLKSQEKLGSPRQNPLVFPTKPWTH